MSTVHCVLQCWPEDPAYYPDYSKESAVTWWTQECVDLHSVIPFDGLWIVRIMTLTLDIIFEHLPSAPVSTRVPVL